MPVPIPGPEVDPDSQKVKFLMISGRPKTGFFDQISGVPGYMPPIPASYQPRSFLFFPKAPARSDWEPSFFMYSLAPQGHPPIRALWCPPSFTGKPELHGSE